MKKEKNILILPLISIALFILGIIILLVFLPIPGTENKMKGFMFLPFILALVLGISVITHSVKVIQKDKTWSSALIFCFISGCLITIMVLMLAFTNVYELVNMLSR